MGEWLLLGLCGAVAVAGGAADDGNSSSSCPDGLLLPAWQPQGNLTTTDRVTRGAVYLLTLLYLFLGVSVISERFMSAIEIITSQERAVVITIKNGIREEKCERVWNETVANLTLMALGSSAPEILLSVIEIYAKHFESGELGPGTIVGSAAYNLFSITALCVCVIPEGETRRIKKFGVFLTTAFTSVFAYLWLYSVLAVISESVVEVWEAVLTFLFFPGLVLAAYIVDKCSSDVVDSDQKDYEILGDTLERAKADYTVLLRNLKKQFPSKDLKEIARIAEERIILSGPKSRAYYRILVTKGITGNVIRNQYFASSSKKPMKHIQANRMSGTFFRFEHGTYTVTENIGSVRVAVIREGSDIREYVILGYCTEDGTAKAGLDYVAASGTLVFKPSDSKKTMDIRIIDDNIFECDEHFFIHLTELHLQDKSNRYVKLMDPKTAKILILDDDYAGEFSFEKEIVVVREVEGVYELPVVRVGGVRGTIRVPYWTKDGTAEAGIDYIAARGFVVFVDGETR